MGSAMRDNQRLDTDLKRRREISGNRSKILIKRSSVDSSLLADVDDSSSLVLMIGYLDDSAAIISVYIESDGKCPLDGSVCYFLSLIGYIRALVTYNKGC
ncbi:hypothetical protein Tco_0615529 [Tanacetum coccineum]